MRYRLQASVGKGLLGSILLALAWPTIASGLRCPGTLDKHPPKQASLFDGDPRREIELVPQDGGWSLSFPPSGPGEGFVLLCQYVGTPQTTIVRFRKGVPVPGHECAVLVSNGLKGAFVLALFAGSASARMAQCPLSLGHQSLTDVGVYDGPVSEMAELIPGDGGWDIEYRPTSKKGYYLACHYGGKVLEISLSDTVKHCRFRGYPHVVCR